MWYVLLMPKLKKVLVTAAGPNMMPILQNYSLPTFKKFADAHDYKVKVIELPSDSLARKDSQAKNARWQKMAILRDALTTNDIAVWLDADILIRRFDDDVASHLKETDYQGFVLHDVPAENRINPNTGVWVMRNTSKAFDFLDAVESEGIPEGRWADQGAVMKALGWTMGDDRYFGARVPKSGSSFMEGTAWLPIGWNQPYCDNRPNPEAYIGRPTVKDPHALHFMAMTIEERMQVMGHISS